jgi:exodeoxyribonuclease V beta subunit
VTPAAPDASPDLRYRKPPELLRLGRGHDLVEASAGTGKTYVLEHLVIELLLGAGATLDQILVVTFTEKATAELTHRIRRKLEELLNLTADSPRARAAADAPDEECWRLDAAARERLRRALYGFDRANIFTIHGFCQRILVENAFLQGRLFDEEPIDEGEAFHAAFIETLRRDVATELDGALLLEAWRRAGYGLEKLEKILFDCHKKLACIYPARDEALRPAARFDAAALGGAVAAWPVLEADDDRLAPALKRIKVHHSTAGSLIRRLTALRAALLESDAGAAALLAALERLERNWKRSSSSKGKDGFLRSIHRDAAAKAGSDPLIAAIQEAALRLDAATPPLAALLAGEILPLARARLERRKREAGLFDFQDMLTLVARSLEGDGERARSLIATLRARYRYALVDEFQDTDEVQWQIFRRLFFVPSGPEVLTLVGDPKQAIYAFRGADVHTYLRARAEIAAERPPVFLTASFRSTAPLIAACNAILDDGDAEPFFRKAGRIRYDHPVTCGQPDLALVDAAGRQAAPVVVLDVQKDLPTRARLRFWEIKPALLDRMAREIAALLGPGDGRLFIRRGEVTAPLRAGEIFVLTRTVRESREVGEALRAARIPFSYFKQEKLFDTVEASEVLDLLRALADPDDRTARLRVWITAFFGLTLTDLAACDELPADHPLVARLQDWRALAEAGQLERLFARIIDDSGIVRRELFGRTSERALTNYLHLFELLQEETARSRCTVRELAQRLAGYIGGRRTPARQPSGQEGDMQRLETDADAVQIMTIHQSKGLEAAAVFIYGGTWPGPRGEVRVFHDERGARVVRVGRQPEAEEQLFEDEQGDEERRVFYVALTRARARLYLPRYPYKPAADLRGAYSFINDRLHAILGGITPDQVRGLFEIIPVVCPAAAAPPADNAALAPAVAAWSPPPELLADDAPDPSYQEAAEQRGGFLVTSYSAVKRLQGGFVRAEPAGDSALDEIGGAESEGDGQGPSEEAGAITSAIGADGEARTAAAADQLPRGRLSGRFLHEIIERLPLETLAARPALEDWQRLPAVGALFERMRRRHDRRPAHLPHALRLVHTALTAPVRLGPLILPGLGGAARPTREMEFLFPIPDRAHPLLGAEERGARAGDDSPSWRIERGVVKGFIDYLFEHQGLVYLCDWKGDWLPDWAAARLTAHCEQNYTVQAQLYTLATLRLLGIRDAGGYEGRFGGVLYGFLRGMSPDDPDAGIYFRRPPFTEVMSWERAMLGPGYWGRA